MPETIDAIMPILQRIQVDVADLKRDVGKVAIKVDALDERMDAFEDYFTYTMGLTQRNQADIKRIRAEIAAIKARQNGPEGQDG